MKTTLWVVVGLAACSGAGSGTGSTSGTSSGGGNYNCEFSLDAGELFLGLQCQNCNVGLECDTYLGVNATTLSSTQGSCMATNSYSNPTKCPTANQLGCCTIDQFPGTLTMCFYGTQTSDMAKLATACTNLAAGWDAG